MDERSEVDLVEFLVTVAEQGGVGGVALSEMPLPVRDGDARRCVLEDLAEVFFASDAGHRRSALLLRALRREYVSPWDRRCPRWVGSADPLSGWPGLPRTLRRSFLRGHRWPSLHGCRTGRSDRRLCGRAPDDRRMVIAESGTAPVRL